jgi:short chain dehydrogenase
VQTMALAPVRPVLTALPVMQRQGHGRIVTIASIGGKIGVPHLLPYSTAKFAALDSPRAARRTRPPPGDGYHPRTRAYTQRLPSAGPFHRAGREGVHLVRARRQPAADVDGRRAGARQIIEAVRARRAEIILTLADQLVSRAAGLAPGLTSGILHLAQQPTLPAPVGQPARGTSDGIPGHALNPALARKAFDRLTALGRAAAGHGGPLQRAAPAVTRRREPTGQRSGADDLLRGSDPKFFEQVCLAPRPGHELVEVPGIQPPVRVR